MNESNDMTSKQDEEAFCEYIDLCLEDHENFQLGFEDARTAFNESFEEFEPFDIAEKAFQAACENKDAQYRPRYKESEDAIYINGKKFYSEKSWRALEDEQVMHIDFLKKTFKERLEQERAKSRKLVEALEEIFLSEDR